MIGLKTYEFKDLTWKEFGYYVSGFWRKETEAWKRARFICMELVRGNPHYKPGDRNSIMDKLNPFEDRAERLILHTKERANKLAKLWKKNPK